MQLEVHASKVRQAPACGSAAQALAQPGMLFFTSGTTGVAKPIRLAWDLTDRRVEEFAHLFKLTPDDTIALAVPMSTATGLIGVHIWAVIQLMC